MELTEAIKNYVTEKLEKIAPILERFEPTEARVEVGRTTHHHENGDVFRAEINLTVQGEVLRAEETTEDLYAAIDAAAEHLRTQVVKYKEKADQRQAQ